jgi:hypothetical protein
MFFLKPKLGARGVALWYSAYLAHVRFHPSTEKEINNYNSKTSRVYSSDKCVEPE